MFNGEVFTLTVPFQSQAAEADIEPIADGCSNNSNYYTDGIYRGTCCCGCDKAN